MWWESLPRTRVFSNVDRETFLNQIVATNQPAIIKGLLSEWPLMQIATESPRQLCAELARLAGNETTDAWFGAPEMNGRFFYSDDIQGRNFEKKSLPLPQVFEKILATHDQQEAHHIFAGGINLDKHIPSLAKELRLPIIEGVDYKLTSLWIGNRTRTAAHWDLPQNLACVLSGRRRFITFPVEQLKNMYFGPIDNTLAGQSISLVDFHHPDFDKFPLFKQAMAHAEIAELEPGDVFYMPSLRIHHVESLDSFGAMINFWWRTQEGGYLPTPLLTLCHALMTIKSIPEYERKAWREIFDYYAFDHKLINEDHIPEAARGILGKLTPDVQQRINNIMRNSFKNG